MAHEFTEPSEQKQIQQPAPALENETEKLVTDLTDEERKAMRIEYLAERKALVDTEQKYADNFDKIALTILGGAIAVSVGFVKDIVPKPDPASVWFLVTGWGVMVLGLLASMLGLFWSQKAFEYEIGLCDDHFREQIGEERVYGQTLNPFSKWVHRANIFVIGSIFLGVCFVLTFAAWNFLAKSAADAQSTMKPEPKSQSPNPNHGASATPPGRPVPIKNGPKVPPSNGGGKKK